MLYKKNHTERLADELFQKPTSEYRGTPFWAWNCELEQKELEWQLEILKKMGFGGAHMHVRTGMATPYLSEEHMKLIKACVQKAKSEGMLAWLYDEDRWPSGSAGGLVTKEKQYRERYLKFTPFVDDEKDEKELLACYDIELDQEGYLVSWEMVHEQTPAKHEKWYAYLKTRAEEAWYNNQTYVNTLDKAAMDRFIEITYESYNRTVSEEFDKTIPAIFTDEPQFYLKTTLKFATEKADVILPWTYDLPNTFAKQYGGEDLMKGLPELIWDRADRKPSLIRYHYHDHVCERFVTAFADNCGAWCREHGLALTGHMMEEPTLESQTAALGEAMRSYRAFDLPGIDMLCARLEYTTAKQTQSAVHQYGREGMLSELYGVTNWDFDFRGHKLHGDWQAALGVTIRVPHLSWVSMAGEAKRDYPASISYQSPWWEKYSLVEDHFARVNTALTRGKPLVRVGVIHPIESYWLHWGPSEQTALVRNKMDDNFKNLTEWLLFGGIDFDFISESLLPDLCKEAGAPLQVGQMQYDVILVPGCETLRGTTLERLEKFQEDGGNLMFVGELPTLQDALPSERGQKLAKQTKNVAMDRGAVLKALEPVRMVEIRNQTGALTENLLHQMRRDKEGCWLYIAHGKEPYNPDVSRFQDLRIRLRGQWKVTIYDTMSGERQKADYCVRENWTDVQHRLYDYDSLLLWLEPTGETEEKSCQAQEKNYISSRVKVPTTVKYTLSEPNAVLLDQAEYALDDGPWQPQEEILRLDDACRQKLGWQSRKCAVVQPWAIEDEEINHTVHLRWHVNSQIECTEIQLAIEDAEDVQILWNGQKTESKATGWYVDKSIQTVPLSGLKIGENILEVSIPFGQRTNVEWAYLLGDFGVEVNGQNVVIVPKREKLAFGSITNQGFPFYGGNVTYHIPVETEKGELVIRSSQYRGSLQFVSADGKELPIIYPPYTENLGNVDAGKHIIDVTLFGNRRNGFGPVHLTDLKESWIGPDAWRSEGEKWCYDYRICDMGILTTPEITIWKEER